MVGSFDYIVLYAFRSAVLSDSASAGTILLCNIIQSKEKKKSIENPIDNETQM